MDLEPAERNPAELRRTALILVAIMILGAAFVLYAYVQHERQQDPDRPPIVTKITKNFAAKNQHGQLVSLSDLEGSVWFAAPISVTQLDENKHAIAMLKEIAAHYQDHEKVRFVLISIEGADQGVEPEQLAEAAEKLGLTDAKWWLLTTGDTKKQRGYIKDQLRLGLVSEREEGDPAGKWKFPSQIALLDPAMHLRQRYDFREAYEAQKKVEEALADNPELKDEENIDIYLHAVSKLKEKLYANTDYVLAETTTGSKE
ncbi:hypothetical protein JIN77_04955 [Verrucomicrobiaceae bacterium R5-34]|uniref:Uncharacterized protein n=1 Tax=Oceaniferula flava TaxID=2800421 RepID=A0AAE2SC58_9BACT|nr:hypothetical protein [Oceaniferula flavus]MBK1830059.1 hypothetical protein [Verrucomicrobiaceae bacterium R5-34]MBK1855094.1 hypothetical protein [Oceaniferula flavus]MBM1136400.1 hypothetical protein [Oceaniferula flavus]